MLVEVERSEETLNSVGFVEAKPFVVVGIPAYNEESSIACVVVGAQKFADKVIVCDDGSTDLTGKIAERLGAYVVRHENNEGYGAAIRSLFGMARRFEADVLVTLDGDGQHDPAEIPSLVDPILSGEADVVIGSRFANAHVKQEMPAYRRFGAKMITKLVNGSSKNGVSDSQSGFRAYSHVALSHMSIVESGMGASVETLLEASKNGLKIFEVSTSCKYNTANGATSKKHALAHGVSVVMSIVRLVIEERPMVLLGIPGLACLLAGIFFGVWLLQIYSITHQIVTNIALASLSFTLISFFMLSTGITLYAISRVSKKLNGKK